MQAINGSLEVRVVGYPKELGTLIHIQDQVCCQGKRTVVYWGLYPLGKGRELWVIVPDVMSSTVYVRRPLLIKEKFHMWDYPQKIWGRINPDQLGGLWKAIGVQLLI